MKKKILIIETYTKEVEVEAENVEKALDKVKSKYDKGKIVLDKEDLKETSFYLSEYNPL